MLLDLFENITLKYQQKMSKQRLELRKTAFCELDKLRLAS